MARIDKHISTRWMLDGKRVPAGTEGAKKVRRKSKKWYAFEVPGREGQGVPLATDKAVALKMLADMVADAERRTAHMPPARPRSLAEYVESFRAVLSSPGGTEQNVNTRIANVKRVVEGCGWEYAGDIDAASAERFLRSLRRDDAIQVREGDGFTRAEVAGLMGTGVQAVTNALKQQRLSGTGKGKAVRYSRAVVLALVERQARGLSVASTNYMLRDVKAFCEHLVAERALARNPVDQLRGGNAELDRRRVRRALPAEEVGRLLLTTRGSARSYRGLDGPAREALYLTACGTGFREGELSGLVPDNFDLAADPPIVRLSNARTKNRKKARQPLPAEVAAALREYLRGKPPGQPVWPGTWSERGAEMLRLDLEDAGIPYTTPDPEGGVDLVADFHCLRHSYITMMVDSGMTVAQAMVLARHNDPKLTLAQYTHSTIEGLAAGLGRMPSLTGTRGGRREMTRDELESVAAAGWAVVLALLGLPVPSGG